MPCSVLASSHQGTRAATVGIGVGGLCFSRVDPAAHPLPQATDIRGAYVAFYMNGTTAVVGSTYEIINQAVAHAFVGAHVNDTSATSKQQQQQPPPPPLLLNIWYNVTVAVKGPTLSWTLGRSCAGCGTLNSGSAELPPGACVNSPFCFWVAFFVLSSALQLPLEHPTTQ